MWRYVDHQRNVMWITSLKNMFKGKLQYKEKQKQKRNQFVFLQKLHEPSFKSLCHLILSTDSFIVNKEYKEKSTKNSHK